MTPTTKRKAKWVPAHPPRLSERMSDMPASLVWFRNDLCLADNPVLIVGMGSGQPAVPVYVLDEETDGIRPRGATSRRWLHYSLQALNASLRALAAFRGVRQSV